jgi:beta-phosphoglucomutase-like phosphatase (HAD superfamily)
LDKIIFSDGTIPGKPAPDIYQIAAKRINLAPKDCIVVEDALSGITAAKNAGAGMIIAIASVESDEFYKNMGCVNQIIHNFDEIDKNLFGIIT